MPKTAGPWRLILLLGLVSLCADATYEGARSISGAYLGILGASGTVVGWVAGLGELISYGLRLLIGVLSDRSQRYWQLTTLGYVINTAAVPLMALAGSWQVLAALMIGERLGKAVRTPPRDVLLSHAALGVGKGLGFGIHEALDQIGAVAGPLLVTAIVAASGSYARAFAALLLPAVVGLGVLLISQAGYPNPRNLEPVLAQEPEQQALPTRFWIYLAAVALIGAGFVDFPLIAFHWQQSGVLPVAHIPLYYGLAMGIDAVAALGFGYGLDRLGMPILLLALLSWVGCVPLLFWGGPVALLVGILLWGVGMGAQESILKAVVAGMVAPEHRGRAYGLFQAGYGVAWFAGSALMGSLYDQALPLMIALSLGLQLAAIPLLLLLAQPPNPQSS
ncbi:MAG: MFS transporter [Thermostichales cyanobacterium BF4_bins_65]